jgi:hypothetical protein
MYAVTSAAPVGGIAVVIDEFIRFAAISRARGVQDDREIGG